MIKYEEDDFLQALQTVQNGGVILYPTDTIWGLGCDATNQQAIDKIYAIKRRAPEQPLLVLVDSIAMLKNYVICNNEAVFDFFPFDTPTTVIFPKKKNLPDNLTGGQLSVAIRLVEEPFCKRLITQLGKPLVSTSANVSGRQSPAVFAAIEPVVLEKVDYVVRYRQSEVEPAKPSVILKWNGTTMEQLR